MLAPYSAKLTPSYLTNDHTFDSNSTEAWQTQQMFPLALRYFLNENWSFKSFLNFYEGCLEVAENIKQKIADLLYKYQLDFAYLPAYSAESTNVKFGKSHSVHKLLTKENGQILLAKCPGHIWLKRDVIYLPVILRLL